jgi:hypothetical protein
VTQLPKDSGQTGSGCDLLALDDVEEEAMTAVREPVSDYGRSLRERVSDKRWVRIVAEAEQRAAIFEVIVAYRAEQGVSWQAAVEKAAPDTPRSTFVRWQRHCRSRTGPTWERLLDGRVPPDRSCSKEVERAAVMVRRLDREIGVAGARKLLVEQFGEEGHVSDSWLKRVWADAGVNRPGGAAKGTAVGEEVEQFHGGAGLAILAAAEVEVGAIGELAASVQESGERSAVVQRFMGEAEVQDDAEGRDDNGRFTVGYNARRREGAAPGETDDRWRGDAFKAQRRDLGELDTLKARPHNLTARLFAMGVTPLLTERRGFDGLDGPAGAWLGVLGATAYMPATLDKTLAEVALLDADADMWRTHAQTWADVTGRWREPGEDWLRSVAYIDGTADPYWTRAFAASGKVSRVGRVMPCLTRIAIHSGAGVPLLVETHAGTASLKKRLLPMLKELDRAVGPGADVGRLTVVDAEMGTAGSIWAMHEQTEMRFVTVLKGAVLKSAQISPEGEWGPYRERDQLREVEVYLRGKNAPQQGIQIRGVQMHRGDGRKPHTTLFVTNADAEDLPAANVVSWYLGRWPRQEQQFAAGRNGGGLNRSHGYGGEHVAHVALEGKLERAERSVNHTGKQAERAAQTRDELAAGLDDAPAKVRKKALALADAALRAKAKGQQRSESAKERLETMPEQIYARDTRRDSVMTSLKLTVLSLIEFAMQEYFGGLKMQWRTFIEQFVTLPVTVRTTKHRCLYEIHGNPRQPQRMAQLRAALDEMNRRHIKRGKQRLVFDLVEMPDGVHVQRSGSA